MLDAPQILQVSAQPAAVIHIVIAREKIRTVMEPAMAELQETLARLKIEPTGPMFSHHLRMDPEVFDFEVGLPVSVKIPEQGRVQSGLLPAGKVARSVYRGGYEGLGAAWGDFRDWIAQSGHATAPDLWECYASGPETDPDPLCWCTELYQPLA